MIIKILADFVSNLLGWFLFVPIAFLCPKKKNRIVFLAYNGQFTGNIKYLYIFAKRYAAKDIDIYFITEDVNTYELLKKNDELVVFFPSFKGFRVLISASIVIVDHMEWINNGKFHLLCCAKKIQLWHGVGFKKIELMNMHSQKFKKKGTFINLLIKIYRLIKGRYPKYDLLVSTSDFYSQHVFSKAFNFNEIINTGYPRNDIFFHREWTNSFLLNCDLDMFKYVKQNYNKKILIYMPTYRDTGNNILYSNAWDFQAFNHFCETNDLLLIIKDHPNPNFIKNKIAFSNIFFYDSHCDVYPLLSYVDLLITDYSSIYTDYLLINKPILFFPYDFADYMVNDREIQFDYKWITPGSKCYSQTELEQKIYKILLQNIDTYKKKRQEIRDLSFEYQDGKSSERIWNAITDRFLT